MSMNESLPIPPRPRSSISMPLFSVIGQYGSSRKAPAAVANVFVAGLMLLFPLGCAIIGLLSWQKLRPLATREERRGERLHSRLGNSGSLKLIISLLCISQLAKIVKWAENKIPRGAHTERRNSSDTDSVEALDCDEDNHVDILFWFNPLASIFADQTCINVNLADVSSCTSVDDEEEEQEAEEFSEIQNWVCESELSSSLETRSNFRIWEEPNRMADSMVRECRGFRGRRGGLSELKIDVSPRVLWRDIPWTQTQPAARVKSKSSITPFPRHKFQRRKRACRLPDAVSKESKADKPAYNFRRTASKAAGKAGGRFHALEEDRSGRKEVIESESMDSDAQHYYSRNRRKKGKAEEAQAAGDEALPYMWELEAVWRRVGLRRQRGGNDGQLSELLDFWCHVEQVSPQHTYTPPNSAPVSPSNSSSSCNSPN